MRKLILAMLAVILSFTLSYAESCSLSDGSLSYKISDCSEQSRACCTGQWCSWGTTSCASCTATTQACSGNVTNACAGNRTRSVTGSCGSTCTYSGWNDSGCSYTQSCTATSESRNCSGNVNNACAGTQTRTRTVAGTCGSCSYNSWGSWSTSGCSYTQSCTATSESRNCSGNVTNACAGTQTRTRTVAGTCGSCSYNSWGSWTGTCTYTQSCTATTQACSGNVSNACAGNRTRTVTGTCGSCSYSGWSNSGCSYTQSCTATSESRNCSGNVTNACAGTQTRTRTVAGTCGSCSYNSWGSWSTSGCSYTQSCTATSESRNCSDNVSGACAGTQTRTRTVAGTCGSCSYNSWGSWSTSGCSYTQSCTATTQACSGNVTNACKGNRTRTVTETCGSCSYSGWNDSGCSYTQSCTATSESQNCVGNVTGATGGSQSRTRTAAQSSVCGGSCSYGSWGVWTNTCTCSNGYVHISNEYVNECYLAAQSGCHIYSFQRLPPKYEDPYTACMQFVEEMVNYDGENGIKAAVREQYLNDPNNTSVFISVTRVFVSESSQQGNPTPYDIEQANNYCLKSGVRKIATVRGWPIYLYSDRTIYGSRQIEVFVITGGSRCPSNAQCSNVAGYYTAHKQMGRCINIID